MGSDPPLSSSGTTVDPALGPLKRAAEELGVRAWGVGGFVRDHILGRGHPDLDVVVEGGDALLLAEHFARITGSRRPALFPRFGTAQVTWRGRQVEFVTARAESYLPDSRKPEVRPASLREDLLRRDFTVNALLMDLDGNVVDPLGGLADLERRVLRTPRDPLETFKDDPLRMLRAVRLAVQLDFQLDPSVLPAIRQLRERARPPVLSVERTTEELRKMLLSAQPARGVELLDESGLLEVLLPEVHATHGVVQGGWHTHDVFGHSVETVRHTEADLVVRLAALLHDVGKPPTATPDGAFHGHDEIGSEMAREALARLRFSNAEVDAVSRLVRLHLRPVFYTPDWGDGAVRRLARDGGPLLWKLLALARADIAASAYPHGDKIDELERRLRSVLDESPSRMQIPVSGRDVMQVRRIGQGPEVGRLKARLEELVMDGTLAPDREALLEYLRGHPEL
ncbi:MAG: CCA tRNA nucleotidyltransferase [Candidatus Dormibacteraeota bacterium]|nr:CCA tRNA nucleotidyltransferase [Candidatus Dormibacteraeota bacterium]